MLRFVGNICCLKEERGARNGERRNENGAKQGMKLLMELGFNYGAFVTVNVLNFTLTFVTTRIYRSSKGKGPEFVLQRPELIFLTSGNFGMNVFIA